MSRSWVALPTEGVDRNTDGGFSVMAILDVALPTEGVDRNDQDCRDKRGPVVALPTEGVDRN